MAKHITGLFKDRPATQFILFFFGYFLILKAFFIGLILAMKNSFSLLFIQMSADMIVFVITLAVIAVLSTIRLWSGRDTALVLVLSIVTLLVLMMSADMMSFAIFGQRLVVVDAITLVGKEELSSFTEALVIYGVIMASVLLLSGLSMFNRPSRLFSSILIAMFVLGNVAAASLIDTSKIASAIRYNLVKGTMLSYNLDYHYATKESDLQQKSDDFKAHFIKTDPTAARPDIIILFAESFSAADSKSTSGLPGRTPEFDTIAKSGVLYKQFIAEGGSTDRAYVSVINGITPIMYSLEHSRYRPYSAYMETLPTALRDAGYHTIFTKTYTLDFLGLREWIKDVGFDEAYGRDEVFGRDERYTFASQPDEVLFQNALARVDEFAGEQPLFMMLTTISTHVPFSTPHGDDMEAAYAYSDQEISRFYQALQERHFFDNGILLVLGDHRKILPMEEDEHARYGDSAYGRVAALAVGVGFEPGRVDERIFSQTDITYTLKRLVGSGHVRDDYNDLITGEYRREYGIHDLYVDKTKVMSVTKSGFEVQDFTESIYSDASPAMRSVAQIRAYYQQH